MDTFKLRQAIFDKSLNKLRAASGGELNVERMNDADQSAQIGYNSDRAKDFALQNAQNFGLEFGNERLARLRGTVNKSTGVQDALSKSWSGFDQQLAAINQRVQARIAEQARRSREASRHAHDGHGSVAPSGMGKYSAGIPVQGKYKITQGDTHEHSKAGGAHAWDYGVPVGTPALSTIGGKVLVAKDLGNKSYGKYVIIQGSDGRQYVYAHLSGFSVKPGQKIKPGQILGLTGNSGNSTGPHLHYEVR